MENCTRHNLLITDFKKSNQISNPIRRAGKTEMIKTIIICDLFAVFFIKNVYAILRMKKLKSIAGVIRVKNCLKDPQFGVIYRFVDRYTDIFI